MSNKRDDEEDQATTSAALSKVGRVAASTASIVLGLAGLAGVFLSSNQAGTALVMAAATLFGIIGLSGHLPVRLKFGDNEITMPIVKAVSKKIESSSPQEAGELAERVISALPANVGRLRGRSPAAFYGQMVRSVVLQLESEGSLFSMVEQQLDSDDVDFSLYEREAGRGKRRMIDVTLKYFNTTTPVSLGPKGALPRFLARAKHAIAGSMLVTNAHLDVEGDELLSAARAEYPYIYVINADTRDELLEKLREVLM